VILAEKVEGSKMRKSMVQFIQENRKEIDAAILAAMYRYECPECCKPDPYEQDREDNAVGTPGPLERIEIE
jgi:hypothetical protein